MAHLRAMPAGESDWLFEGRLLRTARPVLDGYDCIDDPDGAMRALRRAGVRVDLFTFMQTLPDTAPRFACPVEWDNLAALRVSTFDRWWTAQINDKTRNVVRLADKKGIDVREVAFDRAFAAGVAAIYNETPVRQGKRFRHYGKDPCAVARETGTFLERSILLGAYLDGVLVGFAKLVCNRERSQAGLMQILALWAHRDKAPTNALIARAVRACADRGIAYLVYDRFAHGRKERDGLSDFKRHNGFRRVDLPRYYRPLTARGRAALALGLHRPLTHRVPEPLQRRLRDARRRWYLARSPWRTAGPRDAPRSR